MIVYRLSKTIFANDLSGLGAEKVGGRWNSPGRAMIYTSASRALSLAEIAVRIPMGNIPDDYSLITLYIPPGSTFTIQSKDLSPDWKKIPPSRSTRILGDQFIDDKKYLTMKVPSVIVQGEFNFLLNPRHKGMKDVKIISIEPFQFDSRLFTR
jgi:RES domain-containing protein